MDDRTSLPGEGTGLNSARHIYIDAAGIGFAGMSTHRGSVRAVSERI